MDACLPAGREQKNSVQQKFHGSLDKLVMFLFQSRTARSHAPLQCSVEPRHSVPGMAELDDVDGCEDSGRNFEKVVSTFRVELREAAEVVAIAAWFGDHAAVDLLAIPQHPEVAIDDEVVDHQGRSLPLHSIPRPLEVLLADDPGHLHVQVRGEISNHAQAGHRGIGNIEVDGQPVGGAEVVTDRRDQILPQHRARTVQSVQHAELVLIELSCTHNSHLSLRGLLADLNPASCRLKTQAKMSDLVYWAYEHATQEYSLPLV